MAWGTYGVCCFFFRTIDVCCSFHAFVSPSVPVMTRVIAQQESTAQQNVKWGDAITPEQATYDDTSGAIFSMYNTQAQKLDEENVENWTGVADRILIFVRFQTAPSPRIRLICRTDRPLLIYGGYFHCH